MWSSWCWLLAFFSGNTFIEGLLEMETTNTPASKVAVSMDSPCEDFLAWVPPRTYPAVVMQVLSEAYLSIEQNFVYHMELHSTLTRENLYLLCLDESSSDSIESALGVHCVQLEPKNRWRRGEIWELRVKVNRCLLLAGINVIVSDADAIWLNDPMKDMDRLGTGSSNIVAQRDLRPRDLAEYWGVTLCFGFIFFRAGGITMPRLLDNISDIVSKNHDDQKALNLALFLLGIEWDEETDMACQGSKGTGRGVIADDRETFTVSLLPHSTYPRWCKTSPISPNTTVVAHCLSHEKGQAMSSWMQESGVWLVPGGLG